MTAVRGPFVFTSDVWSDDFVAKARSAGCGALALQLGVAPAHAPTIARAAGLQVIGWGVGGTFTTDHLDAMLPDVYMPQAETGLEWNALVTVCRAVRRRLPALPIEPVMTAGGIDITGTDAEKVENRLRRRARLDELRIEKVWVEVYRQDADKTGFPHLGDVEHMISFFERDLLFRPGNAHPVIGLWTVDDSEPWETNPYSVARYDLRQHGRDFGAWRAEQMADERYTEIRAAVAVAPPPPPPPAGPTTKEARAQVVATVKAWRAPHGRPEPLSRLTFAERLCSDEFTNAQIARAAPAIKALLDQEHDEP